MLIFTKPSGAPDVETRNQFRDTLVRTRLVRVVEQPASVAAPATTPATASAPRPKLLSQLSQAEREVFELQEAERPVMQVLARPQDAKV